MTLTQQKKHLYYWDNYKGILIICVVFTHMMLGYVTSKNFNMDYLKNIFYTIQIFAMPSFIFCAGYLSKSNNARSKTELSKLLILYLLFNLSLTIFSYFYRDTSFKILNPQPTAWFLLSLLCYRLTVDKVSKFKFCLLFSLLICLTIGFWGEFNDNLSLRRTIGMYPFFLLGYMFDVEKMEKFINNKTRIIIGLILLAGAVIGTYYLQDFHRFNMNIVQYEPYKNFQADFSDRLLLLGLSFVFVFTLSLAIPNCKIPVLSKWGKNSLGIYIGHRFFTYIFLKEIPPSQFTSETMIYVILGTFLLCTVFGFDFFSKGINFVANKISRFIMDAFENPKKPIYMLIPLAIVLFLSIGFFVN